jgi:cell division septum initiation protein DivIVA
MSFRAFFAIGSALLLFGCHGDDADKKERRSEREIETIAQDSVDADINDLRREIRDLKEKNEDLEDRIQALERK